MRCNKDYLGFVPSGFEWFILFVGLIHDTSLLLASDTDTQLCQQKEFCRGVTPLSKTLTYRCEESRNEQNRYLFFFASRTSSVFLFLCLTIV